MELNVDWAYDPQELWDTGEEPATNLTKLEAATIQMMAVLVAANPSNNKVVLEHQAKHAYMAASYALNICRLMEAYAPEPD